MSSKKVSVTITYVSSGAQPPIFLAGSFSEPAWQLQEMEATTDKTGELKFHKEVHIDEGKEYQYKFRIGLGDWWVVNENDPTVTDDLGNKNNLLTVPLVKEIMEGSKSSEEAQRSLVSALPIPEVIVEKVDEAPRHGDDFGPKATVGQKDAHDMRAFDAEPDHVMIRSQTNTPLFANTAADVADSAATLDREPSPAPVPDEEAGRTGLRRMSGTPISQVALTAAEVADTAAIIDQDEHDYDEADMNTSQIQYSYDNASDGTTPWHERAPLFAHELVGSDDVDIDHSVASKGLRSPTKPEPEEQVVDLNDPTLERFPEDRVSILTHIRSCESRMSEDETNIQGVPPSPVVKPNSRSPSVDMSGSTRIDAQPSPGLDVIAEENHDKESYFVGLPQRGQKLQVFEAGHSSEELNVIDEVDETTDDPRTVLENIKNIEQSSSDPDSTVVEARQMKHVSDENVLEEETNIREDRNDKTTDSTENAEESLSPIVMGDANKLELGPTAIDTQSESEADSPREDRKAALEDVSPKAPYQHTPHDTVGENKIAPAQVEVNEDNFSRQGVQSNTPDGRIPELLNKELENSEKHIEVNGGHGKIEKGHEPQDNRKLLDAIDEQNPGEVLVNLPQQAVLPSVPRLLHGKAVTSENENPDDELKTIVEPLRKTPENQRLERHDDHLESVDAQQHVVEQPQGEVDYSQMNESQEHKQPGLDNVSAILVGAAIVADLPVENKTGTQDVAEDHTILAPNTNDGVLEADMEQSAESITYHPEIRARYEDDLLKSGQEADKRSQNNEHDLPKLEGEIEIASKGVDESTSVESQVLTSETTHRAGTSVEAEGDGILLSPQQRVLDTQIPESASYLEDTPNDEQPIYRENPPTSGEEEDGIVLENLTEQTLSPGVDESSAVNETQPELHMDHEADIPNLQITLSEALLARHVDPQRSTVNQVSEVDSTLINSVDGVRATSVDVSSSDLLDTGSELTPRKMATQIRKRPHTPSSVRSPAKAFESENQKSIWRGIFGDWLGGLLASLCGGERGPLLAISAVVILGPLLAMYLLMPDGL